MIRALVLTLALGCNASSTPPVAHGVPTDPAATMTTTSEDITFNDGVPGTIVHPTAPGRYPGVIFMAGSGPTDRDWNSPVIPGKNGSGKLLAEALAAHGVVVLRFDKAGTGGNKHAITGDITFDIYRDEGRAALVELRRRPDVDPARLFVAGHSEGAYHAARVAAAEGHAIAGVLLLSGAGRTELSILLAQIDGQMRTAMPAQADATMSALKHAFDDFMAGKPVDPAAVTPIAGLQAVLRSATNPTTATLARGLLAFDPLPVLATIDVPVFVFNGEKDIQVDPAIDTKALVGARKAANKDVTEFLAPDANHVLEHETRARAELNGGNADYNTPERVLDAATVAAIAGWLAKH